jgi:SulP family sulfate permease
MADLTRVSLIGDDAVSMTQNPTPSVDLPKGVAIYEIAGPLFFGAAQKATSRMGMSGGRTKVLVIRLDSVPAMDATGLVALESALARLHRNGCQTILCGLQPQPARLLTRAGIVESASKVSIRPDLAAAIDRAREIVSGPTIHSGDSAL